MLVTCQITKEKIDKKIAYAIIENGRNKYYKNKEIYDLYKENEYNKELLRLGINEICGLSEYEKFDKSSNLIYNVKMKTYSKNYKILLNTLLFFKKSLIINLEKIPNTKNKLLYIFKVLEDNIIIGIEKERSLKRQEDSTVDETLFDMVNSVDNIKKNNKGIDKWL